MSGGGWYWWPALIVMAVMWPFYVLAVVLSVAGEKLEAGLDWIRDRTAEPLDAWWRKRRGVE